MTYQTIFVDWDGTLSDSRFWDQWKGTKKYDLIQQALFVESLDKIKGWMRGDSYESILRHAEEKTGIPYDELEEGLKYSAENMTFIHDDIVEIIKELRSRGVKVVAATDNMDTFPLWTVPALKLEDVFDDILESHTLRAVKYDFEENGTSKFFQKYLAENNLKPEETVLIDNSLDLNVVKNVGINFLHVNEFVSVKHHLQAILGEISK